MVALRQVNVKGTYLEQIQNNNRLWINILEHGLADDAFSEKREFALTALGSGVSFPPTPHNSYLSTGTSMSQSINPTSIEAGSMRSIVTGPVSTATRRSPT